MDRTQRGGMFAVMLAAFAGAAPALAVGPDVIVGDLPGISAYGLGTDNSGNAIAAYAVGTTSCNLGTTPLNWISSTPEHPVIGQNMYRLDLTNKRFIQMGQIWLKHGFTALQGTVCSSSCTPYSNGTHLGVNCSDPYSSGLNGGQSGLGPKAEVTPSTGVYPYPWINQGTQGTGTNAAAMFKRLQVRTADLTAANSLFFVSGQYICHDDSVAGNGFNNESYRRCTVNTGSANLDVTVTDTTQRGRPAIYAWQDHGGGVGIADPNVAIVQLDVANDARDAASNTWCTGRVFVAARVVTVIAGQRWRYEYAIENLNSDRGIGSVAVPFVTGTTVYSAGFHDVDYHSGEPYSLTDWTPAGGSGSFSWATQPYATNTNANALRWGTLYNYWIECDASPSNGQMTLGLFKPVPSGAPAGTPTSLTATVVVPGTPVGSGGIPTNDVCANATPVGNGTWFFDTTNAATDGPDACLSAGQTQITKDVWFRYTAPACNTDITASTCGSGFDTKIAVYSATCPTAAGSQIACNDDSTTCGSGSLQSNLTWTATANTEYLIRVGGYNNAAGFGNLVLSGVCAPPPPPPPPGNDHCADAYWVADGVMVSGNTNATATQSAATNTPAELPASPAACGSSGTAADVWYKYRPITSGTITVTNCGASGTYDTVLSAYSGTCGALTQLVCVDDTNAGGCTLPSTITFSGTAGQTYYIRQAGYAGATGYYQLTVTGGGGAVPPANDDCNNRAGIGSGTTHFSTVGATTDGIADALCNANGFNQITNDIWFNHPSLCNGTLTIDTCSSDTNFNTRIAVYDGDSCGNWASRILACNDNSVDCTSGRSKVSLPVVANHNYTIRIGGTNGATGVGTITIACQTPPPCNFDLNCDGNADQDDITLLVASIASADYSALCIDPDLNVDGNVDQDDVVFLINAVAGGGC